MPVNLQDISNLSAEVKALVDAGLPLEANLAAAGSGHGRRLEKMAQSISESLASGKSLDETIRSESVGAPRLLAAAVAAGVRSGRLGEAVEMLGDMANDLVDLRRRILQSVSYPLTVAAMGLLLFCLFIRTFLFQVDQLLADHSFDYSVLRYLVELDRTYWWWPGILPAAGVLCLLFWVVSGRAASMAFRGPERVFLLLPGVRSMIRDLRFYNLARMFAMMVERGLPLHEALQLAGACCGSSALDDACRVAAAKVEKGNPPDDRGTAEWQPGRLPPLLASGLHQTHLHEAQLLERLRGITGYYRRRLQVSILWLKNIVPVAMFVIIGGGSVALYALTVFWPVAEIYRHMISN